MQPLSSIRNGRHYCTLKGMCLRACLTAGVGLRRSPFRMIGRRRAKSVAMPRSSAATPRAPKRARPSGLPCDGRLMRRGTRRYGRIGVAPVLSCGMSQSNAGPLQQSNRLSVCDRLVDRGIEGHEFDHVPFRIGDHQRAPSCPCEDPVVRRHSSRHQQLPRSDEVGQRHGKREMMERRRRRIQAAPLCVRHVCRPSFRSCPLEWCSSAGSGDARARAIHSAVADGRLRGGSHRRLPVRVGLLAPT